MSLTKAERMIMVLEALRKMGRASAEEVLQKVARQAHLDSQDKNLKRNIYRDLKDFANRGEIEVDYFTPSGEKIETGMEEGHKNLRAEYYLAAEAYGIPGQGLLKEAQVSFYPQRPKTIHWSAVDATNSIGGQHFVVIFEGAREHFVALRVSLEEMPVKLVISRSASEVSWKPPHDILEQTFGLRASVLTFPLKTLSRINEGEKLGHAVIEVGRQGDQVVIRDLNSSTGTFYAPATADHLTKVKETGDLDRTISFENHPFYVPENQWQTVESISPRLKVPIFLKLGQLTLLLAKT